MGGSNGKFDPNGNMNRAMLVTVLYRMAGSPDVEGKVSEKFKDCKDGAYYEKAVLWAAANGIVGGYSDGTFKPTNPVNRQELAKILYGYDVLCQARRPGLRGRADLILTSTPSPIGRLRPSTIAALLVISRAATASSTRRARPRAARRQRF